MLMELKVDNEWIPIVSEYLLILNKKNKIVDILSLDNVANWEEVNMEMVHDKIKCSLCYSIIFYHSSFEHLQGPLAFQCNKC